MTFYLFHCSFVTLLHVFMYRLIQVLRFCVHCMHALVFVCMSVCVCVCVHSSTFACLYTQMSVLECIHASAWVVCTYCITWACVRACTHPMTYLSRHFLLHAV